MNARLWGIDKRMHDNHKVVNLTDTTYAEIAEYLKKHRNIYMVILHQSPNHIDNTKTHDSFKLNGTVSFKRDEYLEYVKSLKQEK